MAMDLVPSFRDLSKMSLNFQTKPSDEVPLELFSSVLRHATMMN